MLVNKVPCASVPRVCLPRHVLGRPLPPLQWQLWCSLTGGFCHTLGWPVLRDSVSSAVGCIGLQGNHSGGCANGLKEAGSLAGGQGVLGSCDADDAGALIEFLLCRRSTQLELFTPPPTLAWTSFLLSSKDFWNPTFSIFVNWEKKKVLVTQSYLTLCSPLECSPPGSSVHGIL